MSGAATVVDFSILLEINERLKRLEQYHAKNAELEQEELLPAVEAARYVLGSDATDDEVKEKAKALNKRAYRGKSLPFKRDGRKYLFARKDLDLIRRHSAVPRGGDGR